MRTIFKRLPDWLLVLLVMFLVIVLFAAALLIFEQENSQSAFNSFSHSLWFCTVNMLFGKSNELIPISSVGRAIGLALVALNRLLYILFIAYAIVHFRKRRSVSQ